MKKKLEEALKRIAELEKIVAELQARPVVVHSHMHFPQADAVTPFRQRPQGTAEPMPELPRIWCHSGPAPLGRVV